MTFIAAARKGADAAIFDYGANTDIGEAPAIANPLLMHRGVDDECFPHAAREGIIDALRDN